MSAPPPSEPQGKPAGGGSEAGATSAPPAVVALFGPTGVGKTAVAIALAERLRADGEDPVAISADALQLYRGLEVLTGAASPAEQRALEHRLLSVLDVTESCSAGAYAERAHAEIDAALAHGRTPIVVGGTGLYLRAALADLELRPPVAPAVRERRERELAARGARALHAELPPAVAAGIAPADGRRIVRALELLDSGHAPPPPGGAGDSELWTRQTRHPTLLVALTLERSALRDRIEVRVHAMLAAGAREEVQRAAAAGAVAGARQALGFAELGRGDVDAMITRTRRYAKRQDTWLRKLAGAHRIDLTGRDPADAAREVHALMRAAPVGCVPCTSRSGRRSGTTT